MRKNLIIMLLFLIGGLDAVAGSHFVEAESFSDKGGWVVDQQFTDLMEGREISQASSTSLTDGYEEPENS